MPPYQFGSPTNDFYIRQAQQLSQQYPQFQQGQWGQPALNFPTAHQQQRPSIIASTVTNIEEAKATRIEPMTAYIFLDTSNGKIYFKQFANDGTSSFITFTQEQSREPMTEEIFSEKGMSALDRRLANIESILGELKNAKSVSDVQSGCAESVGIHAAADAPEDGKSESSALSKSDGHGWRKR